MLNETFIKGLVLASKIKTNLNTDTLVGGIIDVICEISKYTGIVVVASGAFMLFFAYKDDNAEQQSRAVRFLIVGALAMGLKTFLKMIGVLA